MTSSYERQSTSLTDTVVGLKSSDEPLATANWFCEICVPHVYIKVTYSYDIRNYMYL